MSIPTEAGNPDGASWSQLLSLIENDTSFEQARTLIETTDAIPQLTTMLQLLTSNMTNIHKGMGIVTYEDQSWDKKMHADRYQQMDNHLQLQEQILKRILQIGQELTKAHEALSISNVQLQQGIQQVRMLTEQILATVTSLSPLHEESAGNAKKSDLLA